MAGDPGDAPKQYRLLTGQAILAHSLVAFADVEAVTMIVPVIHRDDATLFNGALAGIVDDPRMTAGRLACPVHGGRTRQQSVLAGLESLAADPPEFVLIHDGVRPFVDMQTIDRVIDTLRQGHPAALAGCPLVDTLKRAGTFDAVEETLVRDGLWTAQTPQGFRFDALLDAHRRAASADKADFTDDAAVAEWAGMEVVLVEGSRDNVKITSAEDLAAARRRQNLAEWTRLADIRVGTGYDVHAFDDGDSVTLGGIEIAHDKRLTGHSDADVGLHALSDAIYGALGDGDIGAHFPPSEARWKDAASHVFLEAAVERVVQCGGRIAHLDLTIVCEAPKIGPHRDAMRASIARICGLDVGRVAVKATTSERLGFTGRGEGIAALATATIRLPLDTI